MIGIMRHAETLSNVRHIKQGQLDSQLTRAGELQAACAGQKCRGRFTKLLCSDLDRVRSTASIMSLDIPSEFLPELRERDWQLETDEQVRNRLVSVCNLNLEGTLILTHGRTARLIESILSGKNLKDIKGYGNCECRCFSMSSDLFGFRRFERLSDDFL